MSSFLEHGKVDAIEGSPFISQQAPIRFIEIRDF